VRLRQYSARKRQKITVVFDHGIQRLVARASTGQSSGVCRSHSNADRVIWSASRSSQADRDQAGLVGWELRRAAERGGWR